MHYRERKLSYLLNMIQYVYDIVKLNSSFFLKYPKDIYPEIERKPSRIVNLVVFETSYDYYVAVPFRSYIKHNAMFPLGPYRNDGSRPGLDYSKILIITDELDIGPQTTSDSKQMSVFNSNIVTIAYEVYKYIDDYKKHISGIKQMGSNRFNRLYRFSTLKYFHHELGIKQNS